MENNENENCPNGWRDGSCCCNCRYQIELFKHPWNGINKGSVTESTDMFACMVQFDSSKEYKATIFENKHGFCEMYIKKTNEKHHQMVVQPKMDL